MTAPQTVINQDIAPVERPALTVESVLAQWMQNAGGGLGAAILAALAAYWLGVPARHVGLTALTAGGAAFGLLMAIRAVVDEMLDWRAWEDAMLDNQAMALELEEAGLIIAARDGQIRDLERECERLRLQVGNARGRNFTPAEPDVSDPVGRDARALISVYYAHPDPARRSASRRAMESRGWSQDRYRDAMAVLRTAGVVTIRGTQPQWPATEAEALELLRKRQ